MDAWDAAGVSAIGAARETLQPAKPLACNAAGDLCVLQSAHGLLGVPVLRVELRFEAGRLAESRIDLDERNFAAMLAALTSRYGPGEDHHYVARAGMAGELTAGVMLWQLKGAAIIAEQYAGKITRSRITVGSEQALAARVSEIASRPPGLRRDL